MRAAPRTEVEGPRTFVAVNLNQFSKTGWAVVDKQTGAIASDADGRLRFRMSQPDAVALALKMSVGSLEAHYGSVWAS